MNCPYCRASNTSDDHRCQRCGRRLDSHADSLARQAYGREATARALQFDTPEKSVAAAEPAPAEPPKRPPFQPSLFPSRVVSFDAYSPETAEPRAKGRRSSTKVRSSRRELAGQESFRFETVITQHAPVTTTAEPAIGCNARVAHQAQRLIASAIDLSLVIISVALFWGVFYLSGGTIVFNAHTAPLLTGMAAIFYLMYELLWCMADLDSAGMRWAGLRLVNFEGGRPDREQRLFRVASGGLSFLAAGLGILWALVDEESLTWHDHISKTFPTPHSR